MNTMSPEELFLRQVHKLTTTGRILVIALACVSLALLLLGAVGITGMGNTSGIPKPDQAKWQALFITNGQVYFGHMTVLSKDYYKLEEVYYVQQGSQSLSGTSIPTSQPSVNLVKLGGELHGPEDVMYIPSDMVLFWENMKDTSQVVQSIEKAAK